MFDFNLSEVQIIWDPDEPDLPAAKLVTRRRDDDQRYSKSWGSCCSDFANATGEEQINMLMRQFVHMTVVDKIDPAELHELFMQIPEYRAALAAHGTLDPAEI